MLSLSVAAAAWSFVFIQTVLLESSLRDRIIFFLIPFMLAAELSFLVVYGYYAATDRPSLSFLGDPIVVANILDILLATVSYVAVVKYSGRAFMDKHRVSREIAGKLMPLNKG